MGIRAGRRPLLLHSTAGGGVKVVAGTVEAMVIIVAIAAWSRDNRRLRASYFQTTVEGHTDCFTTLVPHRHRLPFPGRKAPGTDQWNASTRANVNREYPEESSS